jgi:diadenosine tetraphosphatase ApaH/serine/threonine PP2A family protein phosphatase
VRYLVISDIHANLEALDAVLADAKSIGYDAITCLGDLVGYGGAPGEVIDRVLALQPVGLIRGNHDKVCAGLEPATNFNDAARTAAEWTHSSLSKEQLERLVALPKGPRALTDGVEICHGAPFDEDYYVFDENDAARAIASASDRICLFGHTHVPAVFSTSDDPARSSPETDDELLLPKQGRVLINVGSVGQPRDGDPRAAYGVLDTDRGAIRMRRVPYDVEAAQKRIRAAGLPEWLAARLSKGR